MMNQDTFCAFHLEKSWHRALEDELSKPYMIELAAFIAREYAGSHPIYPPNDLIFNALKTTPLDKVKVVIVGQDPYHGPGQAHGLSFSVPKGVPLPPSLQNIFKELNADLGVPMPPHGCLISWAEQGILLLNATLTVKGAQPMSHHNRGWEQFTDAIISKLCERDKPIIFVLWGKSAQEKCRHVISEKNQCKHVLLTAPHPSPFSVHQGFYGCRHFSKINEILVANGEPPINWEIK